jgi:hypothetical protein
MKEIVLMKGPSNTLIPCDPQAAEYIAKLKMGAGIKAQVTQQRNPAHHRKFMALLNLAFDAWEPGELQYKGETVQKNFDQFRKDITILAGHFETVVNLKGEIRVVAKSISFASMAQDEFDQLYNSAANVILARILKTYSRDDLDNVINQILGFL